jgi:hypothetical protein
MLTQQKNRLFLFESTNLIPNNQQDTSVDTPEAIKNTAACFSFASKPSTGQM